VNTELSNGSLEQTSNGSREYSRVCSRESQEEPKYTEFDKTKSNARVAQLFKDP